VISNPPRQTPGVSDTKIAQTADRDRLVRGRNVNARRLGLNERQRSVLADKVPDMANLVAAAIVVGFAIGESAASPMCRARYTFPMLPAPSEPVIS
jgi:hypothetical protein